ncbi:hypothetical protein FOMPIDRAFT_1135080 [Fomitopsis schrenkii]|uniref:Uncharacterized protein n=1 Tax=Fomitopsis schrenkii TaxID=2126942 RepID=S8DMX0_FOMSC|nr:hypothetical protein FOMPIDRAFT_1135080 [Fomitopsis schrenkii]
MSNQLNGFEEGAVYVVLHLRSTEPNDNSFHWGLYHHYRPKANAAIGYKYHIRNVGSNWLTDHGPTSGLLKSMALVVIVRIIRSVPADYVPQFQQLMQAEDAIVNTIPSVSCRVWLFRTLQRLQLSHFLRCNDLNALEQEIRKIGQEERLSACKAEIPRPIRASALCA